MYPLLSVDVSHDFIQIKRLSMRRRSRHRERIKDDDNRMAIDEERRKYAHDFDPERVIGSDRCAFKLTFESQYFPRSFVRLSSYVSYQRRRRYFSLEESRIRSSKEIVDFTQPRRMKSKDETTTDDETTKLKHRTSSTMNGHLELTNSRVVEDRKENKLNEAAIIKRIQKISEGNPEHVNDQINDMISEVLNKFEISLPSNGRQVSNDLNDKYSDKSKRSKRSHLLEKEFLERNSFLTDLFNSNKHVQTIYNIFIVILIILFLNTVIYDITYNGSVHVGMNTIMLGFGKFTNVLYIWALMTLTTFAIYIPFNFWAMKRLDFLPISYTLRRIWDYGWLAGFALYLILFVVLPLKAVMSEELPCVSSVVVFTEQVRMLMKSYAFVRSVAPKFLSYKHHSEMARPTMPNFSHYLYFFFAPTLIYRDSYPRTKRIRWKVAFWHYFEVLLIIFYSAFICERFFSATYRKYGKEPMEYKEILVNILNTSMPGILFFLCGFYCLLHAWLNGCAEVTRFADRLFYEDWWTSTSYRTYYKEWNVVVHDWLYIYVYKDIYEILTNRNRFIATSFVFLLSAFFHEYILAFSFRFFFPVMFIMFGIVGFSFIFIAKKTGNIFLWFSLCLGSGIITSLYGIEFYARQNCAPHSNEFVDFILPRSWSCVPISE